MAGVFRFHGIAEAGLGDVFERDLVGGGRRGGAGEAVFFDGFGAGLEFGLFLLARRLR